LPLFSLSPYMGRRQTIISTWSAVLWKNMFQIFLPSYESLGGMLICYCLFDVAIALLFSGQ
jgi:hypothetical protein